jgi:hypothetical protein
MKQSFSKERGGLGFNFYSLDEADVNFLLTFNKNSEISFSYPHQNGSLEKLIQLGLASKTNPVKLTRQGRKVKRSLQAERLRNRIDG